MGRLDPLKGISDLVPILKLLRKKKIPVTLTIVGGHDDKLSQRFLSAGLSNIVKWTGRITHEDCYRLAAVHDLFLLPSRKEPFGMVTIEAMSMGCVPIAYDCESGSTEIIENEKNGILVPLGDYNAWATHIERLSNDRSSLTKLSEAAIIRSRTFFSSEAMKNSLVDFINDVARQALITTPSRRRGLPPESPIPHIERKTGYYRLAEPVRKSLRGLIFYFPKLSYWIINR